MSFCFQSSVVWFVGGAGGGGEISIIVGRLCLKLADFTLPYLIILLSKFLHVFCFLAWFFFFFFLSSPSNDR